MFKLFSTKVRPAAYAAIFAVVVLLLGYQGGAQTSARAAAAPPDFSSDATIWAGVGVGDYTAVAGSPSPVINDPAHPYIGNAEAIRRGVEPTYRVSDLSNPNLTQWAKDIMKKDNDEVLAGKIGFTPQTSCVPAGVPSFDIFTSDLRFIQTPAMVVMIMLNNNEVRHVYLDRPHSPAPKPSWYGESVGHYEGDTLVVDTIGQNTKTFVDKFRTPHSEKLHVVERWRLTDGGQGMEVHIDIDDPVAFNSAWQATRRYHRTQGGITEINCAEGNIQLFDYGVPKAEKADF